MRRRPPGSTRTFTLYPYTTLIRYIIDYKVNHVSGKLAYENKEFLASTDDRFRPVSAYNGPDGALYLVDMYRGIIQHVTYLRSEERRVGQECVSSCRSRWSPYH